VPDAGAVTTTSTPAGPGDWTALGDDWDVEERARARLDAFGLPDELVRLGSLVRPWALTTCWA
jgi:hypothetical protein